MLYLARLIIHNSHSASYLPGVLYKCLVRGVFVHVVVAVFGVFELDDEAVGGVTLRLSAEGRAGEADGRTAWPSGLLFFPPEKAFM
jgi:hypothetical protein